MLAEERKAKICELVNKEKAVRVADLSKQLDITEATVRRDLDELQNEKKLRRTHGGAVPLYPAGSEFVISELAVKNIDEKRKIAKKAYESIDDNDTILFDGSSTVLELSRLLAEGERKGVIVVTNAISVVNVLVNKKDISVIHTGGEVRYHLDSTVGKIAEKTLSDIRVDKTYIGVNGIDLEYGYSITNFAEATVKKNMIQSAKQAFVLADNSKFGRSYLAKVAETEGEIDFLVTDCKSGGHDYDQMEEWVNMLYADEV